MIRRQIKKKKIYFYSVYLHNNEGVRYKYLSGTLITSKTPAGAVAYTRKDIANEYGIHESKVLFTAYNLI